MSPYFPLIGRAAAWRATCKLRRFFLTKHVLKFPFLREVKIDDCPGMKTFVRQEISVSNLVLKWVNRDDELKVDDLNKWTQQRFICKASDGDESEVANESEASDFGIKS